MRPNPPPSRSRRQPEPSPLRLSVSVCGRTAGREYAPWIGRKLRAAHRLLKSPVKELSVVFVGDKRMSLLHRQFMGISGPTDVLSFPIDTDARGRVTSGELIVCIPEARRQAKRRRIPQAKEALLYALHGLLHLSGFDDRRQRQYKQMHRTEDDILARLGVGPVFGAGSTEGRERRSAAD